MSEPGRFFKFSSPTSIAMTYQEFFALRSELERSYDEVDKMLWTLSHGSAFDSPQALLKKWKVSAVFRREGNKLTFLRLEIGGRRK